MSRDWSNYYMKSGVSEDVIEDTLKHTANIPTQLVEILKKKVENEQHLKRLSQAIDVLREYKGVDLEGLEMEYNQIKNSFEWNQNDEDKILYTVNNWQQTFYDEFRVEQKFDDVMIGVHTIKRAVLVTGKVENEKAQKYLEHYLNSKNPPYPLLFNITVRRRFPIEAYKSMSQQFNGML